jgi:hypothetical protein
MYKYIAIYYRYSLQWFLSTAGISFSMNLADFHSTRIQMTEKYIVYQSLTTSMAVTMATSVKEAVEATAEPAAVSGRASTLLLLLIEEAVRGSILMNLFLWLVQGL